MSPYMVSFFCAHCENPCALLTAELTEDTCEQCGATHMYGVCHKCGALTAIGPIPEDTL